MDSKKRINPSKKRTSLILPARERLLAKLQKALRVKVNDLSIFDKALTHRSFSNENPGIVQDNERLEYLGD